MNDYNYINFEMERHDLASCIREVAIMAIGVMRESIETHFERV